MPKFVILDEIHLTFRVPNTLPDRQSRAIRRTLNSDDFLRRLRRAIRAVIRACPELIIVRVSLTR